MLSVEQRHVTLDKGEMRGYDWLFSDVMGCESFQLETISRHLVAITPLHRRHFSLLSFLLFVFEFSRSGPHQYTLIYLHITIYFFVQKIIQRKTQHGENGLLS